MDELIQLITSQAGVDEAKSKEIVQILIRHLEKNLPAPLNKHVEKLLSGQITDLSQVPDLGKSEGGILSKLFGGGKK